MGQDLGLVGSAVQIGGGGVPELVHGLGAGARGGLVGRGDHPLEARRGVQRRERHGRDGRAAVGVGDHAPMPERPRAVHFRNHQGRRLVHAEGRGVVDHHRARPHRPRREAAGDLRVGGEQHEVQPHERLIGEGLQHDPLAPEGKDAPRRPLGGEQPEARSGEIALLQTGDHLAPDRAGGADDRDIHRRTKSAPANMAILGGLRARKCGWHGSVS